MNYRELLPHEQTAFEALIAAATTPKRTQDNELRSACPAHMGDSNDSLATYLNSYGVFFKCYSQGCTHASVVEALGLTQKEIMRPDKGLSLADYSQAKKIAVADLLTFHVRQKDGYKYPHIEIDYYDFDSEKVGEKQRKSMSEGPFQKGGNSVRLYGMSRYKSFSDYVVIVEGESDCHTLWSHGIAAVGVPGVPHVKNVMPDLEELVRRRPDLQLYVFQETDNAGYDFVKSFGEASFKNQIKIVRLEGFKDASELHCHNLEAFFGTWQKSLIAAITWAESVNLDKGKSLAWLKPTVRASLKKKLSVTDRNNLINRVVEFLKCNDRLLIDTAIQGSRTPYVIADDGAAVRIEKDIKAFRFCFQDCGFSPNDDIFDRLVNELKYRADREGKEVKLKRYSDLQDYKTIHISSGTRGMIVVEIADDGSVKMTHASNGKNGVIFSSDFCYPEWVPAEPMKPEDFALFNPYLEAPDQVPAFTPEHQILLLKAWLIGAFVGVKVPILTCTGELNSGKSKTLGGVARLFISDTKEVSTIPSKESDFFAAATSKPVYLIDNLDGKQEKWVPNALAIAATGGDVDQRKLYTETEVVSNSIVARLGVTTRDHVFASGRPDIQGRLLPLFFAKLPKNMRKDEDYLFRQVYEHRNNLFTYLAECAAIALLDGNIPGGLDHRLQSFGKIAESLAEYEEEGMALAECKLAISFCISSEGNNGLMRGIRLYFESYGDKPLQGSASEIAEKLGGLDNTLKAELATMSARHISNALGEIVTTLNSVGYVSNETSRGGTKRYSIAKVS